MPRNRLPLLILLLIVSAAIALWESPPKMLSPAITDSGPQTFPVAFANNSTTRQFGEQGQLKYQFQAERVDYFQPEKSSVDEYALAQKPYIILYNADAPPWYIRADNGHSDANGDTVTLTDNVVVWQIDALNKRTELTTEKLVVFPEREYAQTDKAVKIVAPEGVTTAVGMKAFFNQDRLQLLSNVRSIHEQI